MMEMNPEKRLLRDGFVAAFVQEGEETGVQRRTEREKELQEDWKGGEAVKVVRKRERRDPGEEWGKEKSERRREERCAKGDGGKRNGGREG